MSIAGKPTAFVQCGQWVYPLAAGKSPVLKSAPTTYMFPELGRDGECFQFTHLTPPVWACLSRPPGVQHTGEMNLGRGTGGGEGEGEYSSHSVAY